MKALALSILLLSAPALAQPPVGLNEGDPAPYAGVLVTLDDARICARTATMLGACERDLRESRRRVDSPLPCAPVTVDRVRIVEAPRSWWPVVVVGVVGVLAGGYAGWRLGGNR
jgi:hypothetical protein